jgi:signal transduction histidine kinase
MNLIKSLFRLLLKNINLIIKLIFALVAASVISSLQLSYIESFLYDCRVRAKAAIGLSDLPKPDVVIVYITSKTVEKYKGYPKYKDHALLLEKLHKATPRFVLYNFRAEDRKLIDIDGLLEEQNLFLIEAKKIPNFYIISNDLEMKGEAQKSKLQAPLGDLKLAPGPNTSDTNSFAKDGVSRRILVSYQDQFLIQPKVASSYNPDIANISKIKGMFEYLDSIQTFINFHTTKNFPVFSFEDIVEDKVDLRSLNDKIVIVGTDTGKSPKDYLATPYSRETEKMITTTELQANILQTLIDNNSPVKVPEPVNIAVTFLISILTVYVVLALKPSQGLWIVGVTLLTISVVGTLLLALFGIWIDLAHPFLAIFLCYYFFIPYRLIIENRRSWEYIQKNKLLQQVEELKTNFISMMSHDLKTPIARIQGMTEVILQDVVTLSSVQREAIDTIKGSSDDLLRFINSILQYGRIESQGVELHKQSKDINQLLQDVIRKHDFLAKVKRIKIKTEFEPMFPLPVDVDLMKQVFSNLIENAIKYSHEESDVIVKSREEGDNVVIDVTDNGMGIPAEDLPNIFMKFYRSHNVKTSTIKGTGLGLYLAHYFVELHKGSIKVTSEPQKGSTFRVTLPIKD